MTHLIKYFGLRFPGLYGSTFREWNCNFVFLIWHTFIIFIILWNCYKCDRDSYNSKLHTKILVPSHKYDNCVHLVCLRFWFCHLIRDFTIWILLTVQYDCYFTFRLFLSTLYIDTFEWAYRLGIIDLNKIIFHL